MRYLQDNAFDFDLICVPVHMDWPGFSEVGKLSNFP